MASSFKCRPDQVKTTIVEGGSVGTRAYHRSLETWIQSPEPTKRKNGLHKVVLWPPCVCCGTCKATPTTIHMYTRIIKILKHIIEGFQAPEPIHPADPKRSKCQTPDNALAFLVLYGNPKPFVYLLLYLEAKLRASCLPTKFTPIELHTLQATCPLLKINSSAFEKQLWLTTRTSQGNYRHRVTKVELNNSWPCGPRSLWDLLPTLTAVYKPLLWSHCK